MSVTGVQTCALPILGCGGPRQDGQHVHERAAAVRGEHRAERDRKSVVEGKRVDIGGRRIIKKKKAAYEIYECDWSSDVCSSDLGVRWSTTGRTARSRARRRRSRRAPGRTRSEERRGGKEGRYRWAAYH